MALRRIWLELARDAEHPEGSGSHGYRGDDWTFGCAGMSEDDEEPIFRFDHHRFVAGEYVSITEHDGVQRTFRVAEVVPFEA